MHHSALPQCTTVPSHNAPQCPPTMHHSALPQCTTVPSQNAPQCPPTMHHGPLPQCTTVPTQNAPQCPPDAPIPTDALVSPGSPASHCDFLNFPPGIKEVLSRKPQDTYTEILIGVSSSLEPVEPRIGPGLPQRGAGCSAEPVVPRTSQPPLPAPGQQHHVMRGSPSGRIAPHWLQLNTHGSVCIMEGGTLDSRRDYCTASHRPAGWGSLCKPPSSLLQSSFAVALPLVSFHLLLITGAK
ncbi:unnamed protein product [Arctogadus glacialis]